MKRPHGLAKGDFIVPDDFDRPIETPAKYPLWQYRALVYAGYIIIVVGLLRDDSGVMVFGLLWAWFIKWQQKHGS